MLTSLLALLLTIAPYSGPALNGSVAGTAKFSVGLAGAAGQTVRVRTVGVPAGYIASFCTNRVCAPFAVTLTLPRSGRERIELQLAQNEPGARKPRIVTVSAGAGHTASIAFGRAKR